MSAIRKYQAIIGAALLLFAWILIADVIGRWTGTAMMVKEMREKKVLTAEELEMKKLELLEVRQTLLSSLLGTGMQTGSGSTGVIEFLAACAEQTNVVFELMEPTGEDKSGPVGEFGFRIKCTVDFHSAGRFVSALENGALTIRIDHLEMTKRLPGNALDVTIEAVAYVLTGRGVA